MQESLPSEYSKVFAFDNFVRTHKHVLSKAKEVDLRVVAGSINMNTYVRLHIKDVPLRAALALMANFGRVPVIACGLLQHESKMSVLHFRYACQQDSLIGILQTFSLKYPCNENSMIRVPT